MRTLYRVGAVLALAVLALNAPAAAATSPTTVAQVPAAMSSISGKVTDSTGNPLSGAVVSAVGAQTYSATTATDGSFSIAVPPGVYSVSISRGGFQTAQNDVAVTATGAVLTVALQEANLSSLRQIGRTSTTANRAPFNVSEAAVNVLPPIEITLRQQPNLTDTVADLPGVVATRSFSATPNTNFAVRGLSLQTRVTIDGHPVSSGIAGAWNTNYAISTIFQDVEVAKGTGLNGALAGESAVGTINLRTRDFTRNNSAGLQFGTDSYSGGEYSVFADVNFLKNDRASLIVQKAFSGFNGPWDNYFGDRVGANNLSAFRGTQMVPSIVGLDQWMGDFSNRYSLEGELAKLRYRFSENSSVTLEYLGLQGQYQPQGGSYAAYDGNMTLQACENGSAFQATLATCTASSVYTAPYTFSRIGSIVPAFSWFPNSFIQNNEPQFAAEFRTSFKNDTILLRPYTHLINRYISGAFENTYPGNNGGWYAVTNVANCQVTSQIPSASNGNVAKGPCFGLNMTPNGPAYIGSATTPHGFATTPNAPTCSPTPPYTCFMTPTAVENDGVTNYGTPFSQPELDRLNGYTFSWIHPVHDNIYNLTWDYRKDFSQSFSGDQSGAPLSCLYTVGSASGATAKVTLPGTSLGPVGTPYQPGCADYTGFGFLPRSSIGTPPTVTQYGDLALTGTFQLNERLRLAVGNYLSFWKANAQIEDPNLLALYAAAGNASAAPVSLVTRTNSATSYDPHVGLEYRVDPTLSLRLNGGSSITQPYPALISGFGGITIPNAANGGNYTNTIPNFALQPETTVAYDLGFDKRLHDGGVLSFDVYDDTVHNVFLANTTTLPSIAGICGPGQNAAFPNALCLQTNQINGPIERSYGIDLQVYKAPTIGWGYFVTASTNRIFYDQLPLSIYFANTTSTIANPGNFNINGMQLFGYPFWKGYGQLLYGDPRGNIFEIGADLEGMNNFTFGPPYTVWDASARIRIAPHARLLFSAQNLLNFNVGNFIGRSLNSQGNIQPTVYVSNGQVLQGVGSTANLNGLPPRTFRVLLDLTP